MSDLISRKAVIDILNVRGNLIIEEINRIPTAYDVDGVITELRAEKNMDRSKVYSIQQCNAIKYAFGSAIDIVKGAVKDE